MITMNDEIKDEIKEVIEEKFLRCPHCRSFSVSLTDSLSFSEKIKSYFIATYAYQCHNCSYRFIEYGSISDNFKRISNGVSHLIPKNRMFAIIPAAVLVIILTFLLVPRSNPRNDKNNTSEKPVNAANINSSSEHSRKPQQSIPPQKTHVTSVPQTQLTQPQNQQTVTPEPNKTSPFPYPLNNIILGRNNRFGVNWSGTENGLQIARMSEGPLKNAGLKIGDVFCEVDNQKIISGNLLKQIRDEIFSGKRQSAILKVIRGNQTHYYKLLKNQNKKDEKVLTPQEINAKTDNTPTTSQKTSNIPVSTSPDRIKETPPPKQSLASTSIKVFSQNVLKRRNSNPNKINKSNKWSFSTKTITIKRTPTQNVIIAGNPSGTARWGVDDYIIINGKPFKGILSDNYHPTDKHIPEDIKCLPINISDLIPPGKNVQLTMALADHGIYWGNTDIYIVLQ